MTGRPRTFDEEEALRGVMKAFWRSGYEGTSFEQLVAECGLSRSSLYNAFGGKEELFEKALSLYIDDELEQFLAMLGGGEGAAADDGQRLRDFVETWRQPYTADGKDCLFGKLLLENAGRGGKPRQGCIVVSTLLRFWEGFTSVLSRANPRKQKSELTEREAGAVMLAMMLGIKVLARNGRNKEIVDAVTDGANKVLGLD